MATQTEIMFEGNLDGLVRLVCDWNDVNGRIIGYRVTNLSPRAQRIEIRRTSGQIWDNRTVPPGTNDQSIPPVGPMRNYTDLGPFTLGDA